MPHEYLKPYASILLLECLSSDESQALERLISYTKSRLQRTGDDRVRMIANGFGNLGAMTRTAGDGRGRAFDQILGYVYVRSQPPSWVTADGGYVDVKHEIFVAMRQDRLVAIHCEGSVRDILQRCISKEPPPLPFRRISSGILQGAFLRGEAKGLWLRGTHARRATRPDNKTISGMRLQDALTVFEDSSYAMSSARAALPDGSSQTALSGVVGTTPRRALVWNRATTSFADFADLVLDVLELVNEVQGGGSELERPFPLLATEVDDLTSVRGAYDISCLSPDELVGSPGISDAVVTAAGILQASILDVRGDPESSAIYLDVGANGSVGGTLRGQVFPAREGVRLDFGFLREPTNLPPVREVLDALAAGHDELLTIYYRSGHAISGGGIWLRGFGNAPFPNWVFSNFSGFDIRQEKPPGQAPEEIHGAIGRSSDRSLFGWVQQTFNTGWLVCDDGPGEVADFVHIAEDGLLSLIHVKAAQSNTPLRRVAVGPYEVVASQAAKNLHFLDPSLLRERLLATDSASRAAWTYGDRAGSRKDVIDALDCRSPSDKTRVVVVQPHLASSTYARLRGEQYLPARSDDSLRLQLLETLLNTARASVVALGADLEVIGSDE